MLIFENINKGIFSILFGNRVAGQAIFILGMHRSGTSWLTGALQQAGLHLGKHYTWNPHNRKGNRENPDVYELHESILKYNNASWDQPPQGKVIWTDEHRAAAKKIISETGKHKFWGVKDPRSLFLLEGWKELLPELQFVGIFRHPLSVWASLNARGEIDQDAALSMWLKYNRRLLEEYDAKPFSLMCFDWSEDVLHERLFKVCESLGLKANKQQQDFFASKLRHNTEIRDEPLPDQVAQTYQRLCDLSVKGQ